MNKILFIFEDPRFGGPHEFAINLINNLLKKHQCKLLISQIDNNIFKKKIELNNLNFNEIKINYLSKKPFFFLRYVIFFLSDLLKLLKIVKIENPNYIYLNSGYNSLKLILVGLILKKKIIIHFHDTYCNFIFMRIGKLISKKIFFGIFSSNRSYHFYKNYFSNNNFKILQTGIDLSLLQKHINIKDKKKNKQKIYTVCNINPIKNIDLLIEIANECKYKKNVEFYIICNVWKTQLKYFEDLKIKIKNYNLINIFFLEEIIDVKLHLKKNADLYLCVSKQESSPVSIWEALSIGIPLVSTDVGDLNIFNKKYNFGYILNNNDPKIFSKYILQFLEDDQKKKILSKNAVNFSLNEIDIKKISSSIEAEIN